MKLQHVFKDLLAEDFKTQTRRYIAQGVEPDIVSQYVSKFKEIRDKKYREMFDKDLDISVPPEKRNNIDAYSDFHELEQLVDYVGGRRPIGGGSPMGGNAGEQIEVSGEAVYRDENFEVYYADTPRACIKYKGKFPYSWCVARSDSSNMFYTYRFKPYEPAFYFVKDLKLTEKEFGIWNMTKNVFNGQFKHKYHFFVIQVPKNAKMDDTTTDQYIVSSANNDGDTQMSWQKILKINPKLQVIREVLEPKPFTPEEREKNERFKNGISDEDFKRLSYENKRSYLDIYPTIARPITPGQFFQLPDDLMNLYVSFGIGLDDHQFNFIKNKKDILKRYAQISKRKLEEYLKNENNNRNRLKMHYTELIVLPDADIKSYLESLSEKEINIFIHQFGEDKFEMLEKHLPDNFGAEHKSMRQLISLANNGDEEAISKIQSLIPEGVELRFYNNYIIFDTSSYGSLYEKKLDSDTKEFFERINDTNYGNSYGNDYFDGDSEGLENTYDSELESFISSNPEIADDFKAYGLTWNLETLKDLLATYEKDDEIKTDIGEVYSEAQSDAEEAKWDDIRNEVTDIMFIEDETDINIKLGAFVMFLAKNAVFSTDREIFLDNLVHLTENILRAYDVYDTWDGIWEAVNEAGYNFGVFDSSSIARTIQSGISDALQKFSGEDDDISEPDGKQNVAKLKSQVIGLLNNTLKHLGQDPYASEIENNIVKILIDRSRFQLDGKVYIKIIDKENNKSHEGYVFIKDIPKHFTNHKLFEQINNFKRFIR